MELAQGSPITQEQLEGWRNNPITQQFFLDMLDMYYETVLKEPTMISHSRVVGKTADGDIITHSHNSPVEETAINAAVKTGRVHVFEHLLGYVPSNLEEKPDDS